MSTTTKEDKSSLLDDLKEQAQALAIKIKEATDAQLALLHAKLGDAHKLVQSLTAEIESHSPTPAPAPAKRGRKSGSKNKAPVGKPAKKTKKGKGSRTPVKPAVLAYLQKNNEASPADIVKANPDLNIASVSQCLIGMVKTKEVTKKKERGSPYVLKKQL